MPARASGRGRGRTSADGHGGVRPRCRGCARGSGSRSWADAAAPPERCGAPPSEERGERQDLLQFGTPLRMAGNDLFALLVLRDLALLGHQRRSPRDRIRATAASMPMTSTVLIPRALSVSRTWRPWLGQPVPLALNVGVEAPARFGGASGRRCCRSPAWCRSAGSGRRHAGSAFLEPRGPFDNGNHCRMLLAWARNEVRRSSSSAPRREPDTPTSRARTGAATRTACGCGNSTPSPVGASAFPRRALTPAARTQADRRRRGPI